MNIIKFEEKKQELDYYKGLVAIASKSSAYKDMPPETMLNVMLTAKDLGISPMKAINGGFYIVNGKISMSTALMADRIRKEGHSIKITEWTKDKCVIIGKRRDNEDSVKVEFTVEDAQLAGLLNSPTWKKFPKAMLYNRAMSMLARVLFPDVVGNAYSEDEGYDIMNVAPERRPDIDPESDSLTIPCEAIKKEEPALIGTPLETLKEYLVVENIDASRIEQFLDIRAERSKKTRDQIIDSALLDKSLTQKFIELYVKWLAEVNQPAVA